MSTTTFNQMAASESGVNYTYFQNFKSIGSKIQTLPMKPKETSSISKKKKKQYPPGILIGIKKSIEKPNVFRVVLFHKKTKHHFTGPSFFKFRQVLIDQGISSHALGGMYWHKP